MYNALEVNISYKMDKPFFALAHFPPFSNTYNKQFINCCVDKIFKAKTFHIY